MEQVKPQETKGQRKLILYVERDYLDGRCPDSVPMQELYHNQGYQGFRNIRESLRQRFDLDWQYNLNERVLETIQASMPKRRVDALITHLPYEKDQDSDCRLGLLCPMLYYSSIYGKSLNLISRIKDADPDIMILVYTGMPGDYHHLPLSSGADSVIKKSNNIRQDVIDINSSLDYLFREIPIQRRARRERAKQPPNIVIDDGKTIVETVVNLNKGMGTYACVKICEESSKYLGNVELINISEGKIGNCKDVLNLMCLCTSEGTPVRISVDGDNPEAQILAKRLYSGITSEEERRISFDRFD